MRLLKVLWLLIPLALAGCSSGPKWDKEKIQQDVQANYNAQLQAAKSPTQCTEVVLVPDGEHKFVGVARFADGSEKNVTVTIDPNTRQTIIQ
jgi:protein-disulfide isomerase